LVLFELSEPVILEQMGHKVSFVLYRAQSFPEFFAR
jgi:hypothetical protein